MFINPSTEAPGAIIHQVTQGEYDPYAHGGHPVLRALSGLLYERERAVNKANARRRAAYAVCDPDEVRVANAALSEACEALRQTILTIDDVWWYVIAR